VLQDAGWDEPEAGELTEWCKVLPKSRVPAEAVSSNLDQPLADLFRRIPIIRHCAVHRETNLPVKTVENMVRDAHSLAIALRDDSRAAKIWLWLTTLEGIVAGLDAGLINQKLDIVRDINFIAEQRASLVHAQAELDEREAQVTQSLASLGKIHSPIEADVLAPLKEMFGFSTKEPMITAIDHHQLSVEISGATILLGDLGVKCGVQHLTTGPILVDEAITVSASNIPAKLVVSPRKVVSLLQDSSDDGGIDEPESPRKPHKRLRMTNATDTGEAQLETSRVTRSMARKLRG
jgi:hypothetical protein